MEEMDAPLSPSKPKKKVPVDEEPATEEIEPAPAALDEHDPNFDSEEDDGTAVDEAVEIENSDAIPVETPEAVEFKRTVSRIIEEYFVSEDIEEVMRSFQEVNTLQFNYEIAKRAISMSLDRLDRERELVSKLLSALYPDLLSSSDICLAFEKLLSAANELVLDAPQAKNMLATFLARAVIDEVVPPVFLNDRVVVSIAEDVVQHAKRMLNRDHSGTKLERIWGPGDGRPVQELKIAVDQLLLEYLYSGQLAEACTCVRELQAPHFHHEIIKRAVVLGMEKTPEDREAIRVLLTALYTDQIVSPQQFVKGFDRLYELMSDLVLDIPQAPALLAEFTGNAVESGFLPRNYRSISNLEA